MSKHYHQPSDEYHSEWDFSGLDRDVEQFGFLLGWQASALPGSVGWQAGDEFEAARKHSLAGK